MTDGNEAQQFIDDYFWLKKYNILPREGAKLEQDARFISAVAVIEAEAHVLKEHYEAKANVARRTKI